MPMAIRYECARLVAQASILQYAVLTLWLMARCPKNRHSLVQLGAVQVSVLAAHTYNTRVGGRDTH